MMMWLNISSIPGVLWVDYIMCCMYLATQDEPCIAEYGNHVTFVSPSQSR